MACEIINFQFTRLINLSLELDTEDLKIKVMAAKDTSDFDKLRNETSADFTDSKFESLKTSLL